MGPSPTWRGYQCVSLSFQLSLAVYSKNKYTTAQHHYFVADHFAVVSDSDIRSNHRCIFRRRFIRQPIQFDSVSPPLPGSSTVCLASTIAQPCIQILPYIGLTHTTAPLNTNPVFQWSLLKDLIVKQSMNMADIMLLSWNPYQTMPQLLHLGPEIVQWHRLAGKKSQVSPISLSAFKRRRSGYKNCRQSPFFFLFLLLFLFALTFQALDGRCQGDLTISFHLFRQLLLRILFDDHSSRNQ